MLDNQEAPARNCSKDFLLNSTRPNMLRCVFLGALSLLLLHSEPLLQSRESNFVRIFRMVRHDDFHCGLREHLQDVVGSPTQASDVVCLFAQASRCAIDLPPCAMGMGMGVGLGMGLGMCNGEAMVEIAVDWQPVWRPHSFYCTLEEPPPCRPTFCADNMRC